MKKFVLLAVILLTSLGAWSAEPVKFNYELDYLYALGLVQRQPGAKITRSDLNMHGNLFHFTALYNVNKKLSAGLGFGLEHYSRDSFTIPLFASLRYRPFTGTKSSDLFGYANIGYFPKYYKDLDYGMEDDLGVGWKKMFSRHFGINFKAGYNLKQFRTPWYTENTEGTWDKSRRSIWRHSLEFGFGLVF
jgi:hypothetical protein